MSKMPGSGGSRGLREGRERTTVVTRKFFPTKLEPPCCWSSLEAQRGRPLANASPNQRLLPGQPADSQLFTSHPHDKLPDNSPLCRGQS